ncbi:hypothetical protein AB0C06_28950 [Micromonospora inaquosa]|uniref:DUF4190 domain-containing protein n=1 Tax=Micromonospora inaquosa TaxID=2203716 RepID=A0A3N9W119_9ACTN|nr:DUF4190 domain-containing protein [Micromonospora inaquosa]RQW94395.1 hypothetical protein DLJ59_34525 [Micromonospora inaquosa]
MQPGNPGQDPYGQQPNQDPTAPPPPAAPYGQQPQDPYAAPQAPYGQQPTSGQPYGQQQPYQDPYAQQQPQYNAGPTYPNAGYPQAQGQNNTLGLVALILGIASIPLACCPLLGIPVGIGGAVTGYLGRQKAAQGQASNAGQAKAGLICGAVGVVLGIISVILSVALNVGLPTQP